MHPPTTEETPDKENTSKSESHSRPPSYIHQGGIFTSFKSTSNPSGPSRIPPYTREEGTTESFVKRVTITNPYVRQESSTTKSLETSSPPPPKLPESSHLEKKSSKPLSVEVANFITPAPTPISAPPNSKSYSQTTAAPNTLYKVLFVGNSLHELAIRNRMITGDFAYPANLFHLWLGENEAKYRITATFGIENRHVELQFVQKDLSNLSSYDCKNAGCIVICYMTHGRKTFTQIKDSFIFGGSILKAMVSDPSHPPIILIGHNDAYPTPYECVNFPDIYHYVAVTQKEGQELAKKMGAKFLECSATNGENIMELKQEILFSCCAEPRVTNKTEDDHEAQKSAELQHAMS
jgi:hypothetical protein